MTYEYDSLVWSDENNKVYISQYFNLYPEIKLLIDVPSDYGYSKESGIWKTYSKIYDVSSCATDIRLKTVLYNNCGQLTCKLIHPDCQRLFNEGARVRLYLDGICRFCGFIFTRTFSNKNDMNIVAFDWLRYLKSPLSYEKDQLRTQNGSMGLTASAIFTKICQDLAIPHLVATDSTVPVPAQNYDMKTGFNILEFAIQQTLINSPENAKEYLTYFHETVIPGDETKEDLSETELFKTGGRIELHDRRNLTVDIPLTDELLCNYRYETSIDKQTYNEIIIYKDEKTFLSKTGKTLKKGKKTGTRTRKIASNDLHKGLYGYLPYYHKAPDDYTEAQMQQVADNLLNILDRTTQSIDLSCYGIIGLRAGHLVGVAIEDIGGTSIGRTETDENTGEEILMPVYRTVKECELLVQHPLKMNLKISASSFGEYDL